MKVKNIIKTIIGIVAISVIASELLSKKEKIEIVNTKEKLKS